MGVKKKLRILIYSVVVILLTSIFIVNTNYVSASKFVDDDNEIKILHLAGDIEFPPFEYQDKFGDYRGFNVDILRAIAIEEGFEIKFTPMNWDEAVDALMRGEVDGIQGMKYSKNREEFFIFSESYITTATNIFVLKNNNYIKNLDDFENRYVAVQKYDIASDLINNIPNVKKQEYATQEDGIIALSKGEVNAFLGNRFTGLYNIQKNDLYDDIKIIGPEINPEKYCVALNKNQEQWVDVLNSGIKTINDNGTYTKIYNKWFGEEIASIEDYRRKLIYGTLFTLVGVVILFGLFYRINKVLKDIIKKQTNSLEEESSFKEQIINSIFSALVTIGKDGVILSSNSKVSTILNTDRKKLVGFNYKDTVLELLISEFEFSEVINQNQNIINIEKKFELERDDTHKVLEYNLYPLKSKDDEIIGITFTVRDITADKELREKIIMKDKLESIGRLTTSIAHEIRNPISSIKTYVELLPSKYDNEEFRNTISKDVPYQIQRLDNLITNLLNYSKPAKSQRKVVVLNDVILSSMQLVNQKIISKNISIQVNLIDDIKVYVDQYQLEQVLLNLLLNTIDAVEDVQSPNIEILSLASNDKIILKIIDNGIGIPDMVKKQIFEPFYTTKSSGYGLGLSIVHQLTKENGIEISVDSAVDVGTTFGLSFSIGRKE